MRVRKLILLFIISAVIFIAGCSSSKKSELSPVGKLYHNTTARYNGYYYGRLKLNKVLTTINSSLEDDYTQLLPLFKSEQSTTGPSSDLDSVITKLTVVTQLHPKSKWTGDCYFLIGQSYYYKKDYESALSTFQFVVATYKDHVQPTGKKKQKSGPQKHVAKKKIDDVLIPWPDNDKFINLKHKPIRNEALLWLLKTYIQLKKYDEAKSVINYLNTDNKFPYKLRSEQELIATRLLLDQEKYKEAIEPLRIAIVLTKNKKLKTRYTYILAQLYQMTGSSDKAIETYKKVLTIKPNYKMEFYAQINIANSYSANGKSSSAEILDLLEKMAKNEKYDEFRDQIYYAIAVVYLKQGNKQAAVKNLKLSIENSSPLNPNQKGLSYLKLGELDFDDQHYVPARYNYDSSISFIAKTVTNYPEIKKRVNILDRLVDRINIVQLQDSLQKIGLMPEKQRNNFLDDVIRKAAEKKTEDSLRNIASIQNSKALAGEEKAGGWWPYNAALKGTGFNEYKKKWGNRPNEDNWRRSNKKSDTNTPDEETANAPTAAGDKKPNGKLTRESLLKDIPITSDQIAESDKKIAEAYYGIGGIYNDELKDDPRAIEAFEKLLSRFPTSTYALPSMYALYIIYTRTGDAAKADNYKSIILSKYPDSNFAKAITDPGFLEHNKKKESEVNDYYQATYNLYEQKNYPEVISRSKQSGALYKPNPIAAKFDLLAAFAIAETQPKDSFKMALNRIVKTYSSGEEQQKAKDILALIEKRTPKPKTVAPDTSGKSPYKFNPGNAQFLVIFFSKMEPGINSVIDSLSNYNKKNYSLKNYSVGQPTLTLDKKKEMIVVKEMKNSTEGLAYYNDIVAHGGFFENAENSDHDIFLIDDKNWPLFFKTPNVKEYVKFFIKSYGIKTEVMDDSK